MGIKRYIARKDTEITNAYKPGLLTRATGSNLGEADTLSVYYIANQVGTSSVELSRILMEFPIETIAADRTSGSIPASGSCNFRLKVFNAPHSYTLPRQFKIIVKPISRYWDEGHGVAWEDLNDLGYANWISASSGSGWTTEGGDFEDTPVFTQYFDRGWEDLEIDITSLVEDWLNGDIANHGIGIMLSSSYETGSDSYFTKKFFARGTEYFFKRPMIEVAWDSSQQDDRGNFYASSALAPASSNLNTLYLHNRIHGQLTNIPSVGTGSIYVNIFTSASGGEQVNSTTVTGGWSETGVYTASFALQTTASLLYDRWEDSSGTALFTGSFRVKQFGQDAGWTDDFQYVTNITNLKSRYSTYETAKFRVFTRKKNWNPTIYTVATNINNGEIIDEAHFKVYRVSDDLDVIAYDTGSTKSTKLSYDVSGSYFELPMNLFEEDSMYAVKFLFYINGAYREQPEVFKFRVEEN